MAYQLPGRIGQVLGPFDSTDLLAHQGAIGIFTPQISKPVLTKLGIQTQPGTLIKINGVEIKIGCTGMYELDNIISITSLIFPNGASEDTMVDFVY